MQDKHRSISLQAVKRMPYYLQCLKEAKSKGMKTVASTQISEYLQLNEVQVRKDLSAVCTTRGRPKMGFLVDELIANMEEFLGYNRVEDVVVVGTGSLGRALLSNSSINECGFNIVAAFDNNPKVINKEINGIPVLPVNKLSDLCRRMNIKIGVIAVPSSQAQIVCDQLVAGGVRAIWSFSQVHLFTPDNVIVKNENLAASLTELSKQLQRKIYEENEVVK